MEASKLDDSVADLRAEYLEITRQTYELETKINDLRQEFSKVKNATNGICPTCGSKVPAQNMEKIQARLNEIIAQGKSLAEDKAAKLEKLELIQKAADVSKNKSAELREQSAELKRQFEISGETSTVSDDLQNAIIERDNLQDKLSQLKLNLSQAERNADALKRVEELKSLELQLAQKISACDKNIFLAENFIRRKIQLLEKSVNQNFKFVSFKMFESFKVADGVKECCEPFLNGVPYYALSKGEQLKASLDILQALQNSFGVELPIFIDDAESYTSNSLLDLPNQFIRLVAAEGVQSLKVTVADSENVFEGRLSA